MIYGVALGLILRSAPEMVLEKGWILLEASASLHTVFDILFEPVSKVSKKKRGGEACWGLRWNFAHHNVSIQHNTTSPQARST